MGSTTEQVQKLQELLDQKMSDIFPKRSFRVSQKDKPWINFDLKKLDRLKKREYRKHGKSEKYRKLLEKFNQKYEIAANDHLE